MLTTVTQERRNAVNKHTGDTVVWSNSLAGLAARIRVEHEAVAVALRDSVRHAIVAGELLVEAKAQLVHGQWRPWLREHCAISERTAQLYMRVAKNRAEIEAQIRNDVADLTLSEAAALLMLSSDARKLLDFAKQAEGLAGEAFIEFCVANNVAVLKDPNYDPFAGRSEAERIEWLIFSLFLSYDGEARRPGYKPDDAWQHVEYLLQRPFQNVDEWLGPEGTKWRRRCGMGQPAQDFHAAWAAFRDAHRDLTLEDINAKGHALKTRFEKDRAERIISAAPPRRGRGSGQA
jgi:hypothetical protein